MDWVPIPNFPHGGIPHAENGPSYRYHMYNVDGQQRLPVQGGKTFGTSFYCDDNDNEIYLYDVIETMGAYFAPYYFKCVNTETKKKILAGQAFLWDNADWLDLCPEDDN